MEFTRRSLHSGLSSSSQGPALSVSGSVYRKGGMQHLAAAPSVYGGAGGQGIRISNSRHMNYGSDHSNGDLYVGNGKTIMQNLNERLASYLAKVQSLERSNSKLELQIKQWYEANAPSTRDYNAYYQQIEELQNREVDSLQRHLGNTVNVELDAAPALNLGTTLNEMRQKYEVIAQENLQKAKEQFEKQTQTLQQQVTVNNEELKETEAQLKELRRTYQNLEIELQSLLRMKETLEHTLEETKDCYSSKLFAIQAVLDKLEAQLEQIKTDAERQGNEYNILLDIKTRLEQEIATYRRLLEGEDVVKTTENELRIPEEKNIKRKRKIMTVVEEVVDGKVVSCETKEVEEDL